MQSLSFKEYWKRCVESSPWNAHDVFIDYESLEDVLLLTRRQTEAAPTPDVGTLQRHSLTAQEGYVAYNECAAEKRTTESDAPLQAFVQLLQLETTEAATRFREQQQPEETDALFFLVVNAIVLRQAASIYNTAANKIRTSQSSDILPLLDPCQLENSEVFFRSGIVSSSVGLEEVQREQLCRLHNKAIQGASSRNLWSGVLKSLDLCTGSLLSLDMSSTGYVYVAEIKELSEWPQAETYERLEPGNVIPLILNVISCFLFMMNNYIIEPSSAYYANALGSTDALSGVIIGASPLLALLSAIVYSFWTNYNYRHPMLISSSLSVAGNWLYASAYSHKSITMCLFGRALTGLGASRVINRRYIADAIPFCFRTKASVSLAMATALGAALGPACAMVLDQVREFKFRILGQNHYFNSMTGPAYFMALLWTLHAVTILAIFKEPLRSGVAELKQREQQVAITTALGRREKNGKQPPTRFFCGCWKHLTRAVIACMMIIFMKRIALESIVASTSAITKNRYEWSITNVGALHLFNGIITIPVSFLAGWLSGFYQDRYLAVWCLSIALVGVVSLIDVTDVVSGSNETYYNRGNILAVGPVRYVMGSLIAFSGIEACESFVVSLMSKVVPSALAVGTFNSGLLLTLVGTGGRAAGDLLISLMGTMSIRNLLNLLVLPAASLLLFSMLLIRQNYRALDV